MLHENNESYKFSFAFTIPFFMSSDVLNGEVTCGAKTQSYFVFVSFSIKSKACNQADSEVDLSLEILLGLKIFLAPYFELIDNIFLLSELTYVSSIPPSIQF